MTHLNFFGTFFVFAIISALALAEDNCKISYKNCPSGKNNYEICLGVTFDDYPEKPEETIVLKRAAGRCSYKGHFLDQKENIRSDLPVRAHGTCTLSEATTDLGLTFVHEYCDGVWHNNLVKTTNPTRKGSAKNHVQTDQGTGGGGGDGVPDAPRNISYAHLIKDLPEHGFDFTVLMVIDDLFVKYVAGDDVNEAIKIAGDVFEEAAFYFTGEFAKGLGTKVHFIYENTKYIPGYRFESSSKFGEYLHSGYPSLIEAYIEDNLPYDVNTYAFLTWDHWKVAGSANLPRYRVENGWRDDGRPHRDQGVCGPRGKRATITTYGCSAGWRNACEYTDVEMIQHTGRVVAHEIGHTLNMHHDFGRNGGDGGEDSIHLSPFCGRFERYCPEDGSYCTDTGGMMDYPFPGRSGYLESCLQKAHVSWTRWTCCSKYDFLWYYNEYQYVHDRFCLRPHTFASCQDEYGEKLCNQYKANWHLVDSTVTDGCTVAWVRGRCAKTCEVFDDCAELH